MSCKMWGARAGMVCLTWLAVAGIGISDFKASAPLEVAQQNISQIGFITAEELKAKLANNEPVTIVDVRSASSLANGGNKIKGAVYVKLRRLKSRLSFPPLRDVSRTREVVTYCACPNDEASMKAAQTLAEAGFKQVRVLKGGWVDWKRANGQVEPMGRVM